MTVVSHVFPHLNIAYTPDKKKPKRKPEAGYKLNRKPKSDLRCLLTDHQVVEARWLSDFAGWSHKQVRAHYGLSAGYTNRLLDGSVRSKVRPPRQDDFPIGYRPQPASCGLSSACLGATARRRPVAEKMTSREAIDFLLSVGVGSIELEDGRGTIDVANTPGGLLVALEQAKTTLREKTK